MSGVGFVCRWKAAVLKAGPLTFSASIVQARDYNAAQGAAFPVWLNTVDGANCSSLSVSRVR